jgi:hypothetical protein
METQSFEEFELEYVNGLQEELSRIMYYYNKISDDTGDSDINNNKLELLSWARKVLDQSISNEGRNDLYSMIGPILEYFEYYYSEDL